MFQPNNNPIPYLTLVSQQMDRIHSALFGPICHCSEDPIPCHRCAGDDYGAMEMAAGEPNEYAASDDDFEAVKNADYEAR